MTSTTARAVPTSHSFAAFIDARPAEVWDSLTSAGRTPGPFRGLTVSSSWQVGDPVTVSLLAHPEATPVDGEVLHVEAGCRVSYAVYAGPGDPCTFFTWHLRPSGDGCVVTLEVDDVECPETRSSAEDVWLPVLAWLQFPGATRAAEV